MQDKPAYTFPCDYPFKIIVRATEGIDAKIIEIINQHQSQPFEGVLTSKNSKESKYISFSIVFHANSQKELEDLFEALRQEKDVMMLL